MAIYKSMPLLLIAIGVFLFPNWINLIIWLLFIVINRVSIKKFNWMKSYIWIFIFTVPIFITKIISIKIGEYIKIGDINLFISPIKSSVEMLIRILILSTISSYFIYHLMKDIKKSQKQSFLASTIFNSIDYYTSLIHELIQWFKYRKKNKISIYKKIDQIYIRMKDNLLN